MKHGGFGGQFASSRAGADSEIIIYDVTTTTGRGESTFLGAVGVRVGVGCGGPNTYL